MTTAIGTVPVSLRLIPPTATANNNTLPCDAVCRKDEKGRRKYDCPRPASQTGKRKEMDLYYYPHKSQAYHGDSLVDMRYLQDPYNCPDCHNDTVLQNRRVGGRIISVDEIVHGYQILFERLQMYSYINFMGVPMQQDPNDAFALMDMIWRIKPDVIIEMGTAGGGSSFFYSFVMSGYNSDAHLITFDPKRVVDWNRNDIRKICPHCIDAKETPLWKSGKIKFFNADPVDKVDETRQLLRKWRAKTVMVIEDGNHLYPTVYRNINAYAQFVTPGSYLVVQDTKMDSISPFYEPESPSEIPFTATEDNSPTMAPIDPREQGTPIDVVDRFLEEPNGKDFERDRRFEYFLFSNHLKGFLKRVR